MGEMIKIGRRGSLTARLDRLRQAGPYRLPRPRRATRCRRWCGCSTGSPRARLDEGTAHFDPSTLAITTVDIGNPAANVIPAEARATVNIRFNDAHSGASALRLDRGGGRPAAAKLFGVGIAADFRVSGESFLTPPGPFTDLVARAVEAETGVTPELSTSGGTSDARFIKDHCPVVEFGLVGATMHQTDEQVEIAHVHAAQGRLRPHPRRLFRRRRPEGRRSSRTKTREGNMTVRTIHDTLDAMTLEEHVSLLSGEDFWSLPAVLRVGIGKLRVTDGPNGARGGGSLIGGVKSAAFPVGIALGATWNPDSRPRDRRRARRGGQVQGRPRPRSARRSTSTAR